MLHRSVSDETLSTLVTSTAATVTSSHHDSTSADAESLYSADTLAVSLAQVFSKPLHSYRIMREFPLATCLLRNEIYIYSSMDALKQGSSPLLSMQPNKLHFLKKNAPLQTVSRHRNGQKEEFCKIYYKILENNLACYVMMFTSGDNVVFYNNGIRPHSDTTYRGTKLRLYGASGATSTFGSNSMRMYALSDNSPTLVDFVDDIGFVGSSIKSLLLHAPSGSCKLYDSVVRQNRNELLLLLAQELTLVNVPIASFVDAGGAKVEGARVEGILRIFESTSSPSGSNTDETDDDGAGATIENGIAKNSMVLATAMAIFVEQEMQKMRGNLK